MVDIFAMEEQFTGDYKKAFSKISLYGTMAAMDQGKYEDRLLDIYDMLLQAQSEGRPVEMVIGGDIEAFCKEYYKSHDKSEWIGNAFKRVFTVLAVIFVYSILEMIFRNNDETDIMQMQVNMSPIIIGLIVGVVVICIQKLARVKLLFKTDKIKSLAYSIGILVAFIACIAAGMAVFNGRELNIPALPVLITSGVYLVIYILAKAIIRYKKYGSLKNPDKAVKLQLKEYQKEVTLAYDMKTSAIEMEKRFDKMNVKLAKKGKEPITYAEFAEKIRKDHKFTKVVEIALFLLIIIIAIVNIVIGIDDEEVVIRIASIIISSGISFAIYRFGINAIKEVELAQRYVLAECEEKNIDIKEYVANMANLENNG